MANKKKQKYIKQSVISKKSAKSFNIKNLLLGFGLILWLVMVISIYIWENQSVITIAHQIELLKKEKLLTKKDNSYYKITLAGLMGRERVERIAREELGLHYPGEGQVVFLNNASPHTPAEHLATHKSNTPQNENLVSLLFSSD